MRQAGLEFEHTKGAETKINTPLYTNKKDLNEWNQN